MTLKLINTPNQTIPFYYGNYLYELILRMFEGCLYGTVKIDNDVVVASRRIFADADIFEYDHLKEKYGNLIMRQKFNTPVTEYANYNSSVYLEFLPPES